jgi:predicted ATPase
MQRFILTGAPGAGKTMLIRELERLGYPVIEEAATDVIALETARNNLRPWEQAQFIEKIATLQQQRLKSENRPLQFHDRSLVCTAALSEYLGFSIPAWLDEAILTSRDLFEPRVFFVRLLGFITPTEARRISLEDSQRFEEVHETVYRRYGFALEYVQPADLDTRIGVILAAVARSGDVHLRG